MTPHTTLRLFSQEAFAALGGPDLVYVRPVTAAEILAEPEVRIAEGASFDPDQVLYAVHRADGERLAVMTDRETAVAAALAHELAPVSVH